MITFPKSAISGFLLVALSFAPALAQAGIFDDDEARKAILDLRGKTDLLQRDLRELTAQIENKSSKTSTLELVNQNEQLREDVARLRGQIEVLTNELSNAQRRQKDFYVDLDTRLRKLEPQKITVDGREANVDPAEQKSYDAALALFKAGDFKNAGTAFSDFLRRYPDSGYAASAQYWLGNSYYAQRDYRNAIAAQQVIVRNYPDNPKASDALLNIASCYTELKEKAAAKKTLETLLAQYPDSNSAPTARDRLNSLK